MDFLECYATGPHAIHTGTGYMTAFPHLVGKWNNSYSKARSVLELICHWTRSEASCESLPVLAKNYQMSTAGVQHFPYKHASFVYHRRPIWWVDLTPTDGLFSMSVQCSKYKALLLCPQVHFFFFLSLPFHQSLWQASRILYLALAHTKSSFYPPRWLLDNHWQSPT